MESPPPVFFPPEKNEPEVKKEQKEQNEDITFEDLPDEDSLIPWKAFDGLSTPGWSLESRTIRRLVLGLLFVGYNAFLIAAIVYNRGAPFVWDQGWYYNSIKSFSIFRFIIIAGWGRLVVITAVVYAYMFYAHVIKQSFSKFLSSEPGLKVTKSVVVPASMAWHKFLGMRFTALLINLSLVAAFFAFVIIDSQADLLKLQSAFGIVAFVLLGAACSKHPSRIKWRTIMWGLSMQFIMGLIVLRWKTGDWRTVSLRFHSLGFP